MSETAAPVLAVKLGGSLLTDKRRPGTDRPEVLARLAGELAAALRHRSPDAPRIILGHGSGSFGHVAAAEHRIATGIREERQLPGVSLTQRSAAELHRRVTAALAEAGLLPFSIAPSSAMVAADGAPAAFELEPLTLALRLRLLPVVYGDVVLDRDRGATICSTETLFLELARRLPAAGWRIERVLWLGETDGVLDASGRTVAELRHDHSALAAAGAAAGTDVTGGMRHRVDAALALADLGVESLLFDGTVPGRLQAALDGEPVPGTRVPAAR